MAPFLDRKKKRLSAEIAVPTIEDCSNEKDNAESLQFDIVQREKWDLSKNIKLINQSEKCAHTSSNEAQGGLNVVLDSLDLAGMTVKSAEESSEKLNHIRSKSDFSGTKRNEYNEDRVKALGIIIKKGETNHVIESPSMNIGEVEDDDENQDDLEISDQNVIIEGWFQFINSKEEIIHQKKHVRHSTLGFVESMVEQLEILRSSDSQNTTKIADIEYELSKIGEIVRDALRK